MQTHRQPIPSRADCFRRTLVCLLCLLTLLPLQGCALPRLEGRAESEHKAGACERSYQAARADSTASAPSSGAPLLLRYQSAQRAPDEWAQVAAHCPQRFAEGTMRSGQASLTQAILAGQLGAEPPSTSSVLLTGTTGLDLASATLAAMALAEDRAGFALQLLAARRLPGADLAISDDHAQAGQQFMSMAAGKDDPRQKVYDLGPLLEALQTSADSIDANTGLTAPLVAQVEMNCVREELAAMQADRGKTENSRAKPGRKSANGHLSLDDTASQRPASLLIVSRFISARAYRSLVLGYPAFDTALYY
ncbi:hypothetical protein CRD60_05955 [Bifidobacterium aemilianum]|uniref:Uncharacterized protein n=1 Tax=Bifidobacterium aemilianum TaxID=2493120 RepID=A0A366K8P4_9BIFI|nr:hypothetical protein [Bifidobacterium aemilianum]RBP97538.1 hypothetical protein CRD60_05955 [Bifidobacterium aemilianum]